tara:strand:- start:530 stop:748 length:219 start_codon:yes stop_codon:yes gene_type:complete
MIQLISDDQLIPFTLNIMGLILAALLGGILALYVGTHPARRYAGLRERMPGYLALYAAAVAFNHLVYLITYQ